MLLGFLGVAQGALGLRDWGRVAKLGGFHTLRLQRCMTHPMKV